MPTIKVNLQNLPKLTNNKFYPLFIDRNRYLVLMGGGGSGKSVFIASKIILRILSEKNHRILVLRKVAKTLRESVYAELRRIIFQWGLQQLFKIHKGELLMECANGNQILFAGLDDVEKLKSISGITAVWLEEASECSPEDFRQLDIRLRGQSTNYKQFMITFNPIDINHWLKKEFFDVKKDNATTIHSTYHDNRFLDDEAKKVLEGFKLTDPYYYSVYALGEWGVLGKTIFPKEIVSNRIAFLRNRQPLKVGYFAFEHESDMKPKKDSIKWVSDPNGHIRIYEESNGKSPYVLGGDTAGEGSDFFSAHVINNGTGNQVATLHQQFDEIDYAQQCYCLATHYNGALVGLEVNFSTYPTKKFEEWNYPKLYMREVPDTFTHKLQKKFGFTTTKLTRPLIIAELVTLVREQPHLFNDIQTLEEMLTFVKNENGRAEAQDGARDDLLMGLAITYHIREQQSYAIESSYNVDISKLPQDLQDDYNRASAEDKKRMAQKWGVVKGA